MRRAALVFVCAALAPGLCAQVGRLNLIDDPSQWSAGIDKGSTKMTLAGKGGSLTVDVAADGGDEDYPKARQSFAEPQDWRPYARLRTRLRVDCQDPSVRRKQIAFVFYDEQTRLPDYPGNPMRQQVIAHSVPVNRWVDLSDWLMTIQRATIRQLDLYLYEVPPVSAHQYRWEFAKLELEKVSGEGVVFDTQVFGSGELKGAVGKPSGSVRTEDGLELTVGSAGEIARLALDGKPVGAATRDCPTGLLVRDAAKGGPPVMVGGEVKQAGKEVRQTARLQDLGLAVSATYRTDPTDPTDPAYIEVTGTVADTRGEDRAVTVYLAVPVAAGEWQWWDSMSTARVEAGEVGELSCVETGVGYGLEGSHSKYPLGAVTLPGSFGLSLAVRMDEPVVHRLTYNPRLRLFFIALDFGLVPERRVGGRPLSEAAFRILLYRHDPAWGFRSALQRYYELLPDLFTKRVTREGGWYVWGDMSKTEGALEAGFGFHWGPSGADAVKWDNANGPLALFYIEPETYQQTMEDFDRGPTFEEVVGRLGNLAQGDEQELAQVEAQPYRVYPLSPTGGTVRSRIQATAQCVLKSFSHDETGQPYCSPGQFGWMSKSKWGAILACNLAPGIPEGKGWFNRQKIIEPSLQQMEEAGAHYDGIGLDSFGGYGQAQRVNHRREHFQYADYPLSFSALDHQPVQVAAFGAVEWVRDLAKDMHGRGKVLMANCSWGSTPGWLTFAAPYLDIFGAEATRFADPDFIRAIAYRKPCTDLPYDPRPEWEVPWHWLHGIYPGHGNDLKTMQRCDGLLRELVAAGWEPITGARVKPEQVRVERYGSGDRVYLVLHNPAEQPTAAQVQLDEAVLGAQDFAASVQPGGQKASVRDHRLEVQLEARGAVAVVLSRG
jgi:hypothetical protein